MYYFCGKQGLPLRGRRDDSTCSDSGNKGNFLELVHFRAKSESKSYVDIWKLHLGMQCIHQKIQNEIIAVIGDALQRRIINEIKKAKYFTILADEVTDCANLE